MSATLRAMLERERLDLLDRLTRVDDDRTLLVLERALERRAIKARLLEIDEEMESVS